jgi:hypothetical protein
VELSNLDIPWKQWIPAFTESGALWAVAGAAATLFVVGLVIFFGRLRASWRSRSRMSRAVRGEHRAVRLLEQAGWKVIDSQVGHTWSVGVGSDTIDVDLRADHLVRRAGRCCVAEVKTGQETPSVSTAATRRQLLEYHVAFDVDGVLLVDIERETVRRVHFDL